MKIMSNAFFQQAEIVQNDHWNHGPLELVFVPDRTCPGNPLGEVSELAIFQWNQNLCSGFLRPSDTLERVQRLIPGVQSRRNPNLILVPQLESGLSQLDVMLASLLPDSDLATAGIERKTAIMSLSMIGLYDADAQYSAGAQAAFSKYIWTRLVRSRRRQASSFSTRSPLRLLSGDTRYWMNRIYRVALDVRESCFPECDDRDEPEWKPLSDLRSQVRDQIPIDEQHKVSVRRPLKGGQIWDPTCPGDRDWILRTAIDGGGVLESVEPVIELLLTHSTHEDFSERYSWIKEDFERSFYSKRAKLNNPRL